MSEVVEPEKQQEVQFKPIKLNIYLNNELLLPINVVKTKWFNNFRFIHMIIFLIWDSSYLRLHSCSLLPVTTLNIITKFLTSLLRLEHKQTFKKKLELTLLLILMMRRALDIILRRSKNSFLIHILTTISLEVTKPNNLS
jgi:hypothetical protein